MKVRLQQHVDAAETQDSPGSASCGTQVWQDMSKMT